MKHPRQCGRNEQGKCRRRESPGAEAGDQKLEFTAPLRAPFAGQKPGDGFLTWFQRNKTNPLDTCGLVTVWHAEVRYTSAP